MTASEKLSLFNCSLLRWSSHLGRRASHPSAESISVLSNMPGQGMRWNN